MSVKTLLKHMHALPDAASRLQFRVENLPLGYLATSTALYDIIAVLEERDRLHQDSHEDRLPITAAYLAVE